MVEISVIHEPVKILVNIDITHIFIGKANVTIKL